MELHEAIKKAIELQGIEVLTDIKLVNILADLQVFEAKSPIVKNLLTLIVREKLLKRIVASRDLKNEYILLLSDVSVKLVNEYGYRNEIVTDVIGQISEALKTFTLISHDDLDELLSTEVTKEDLSVAFTDKFGVKYSQDGLRLLKASNLNLPHNYKIREGTMVICDWAFSGCQSLENLDLPNSLVFIGESAFSGCKSLSHMLLPNSVKRIGNKAFRGCKSLLELSIPSSITNIGEGVFNGCNLQIKLESPKFFSDGVSLIDTTSQCLLSCLKDDLQVYTVPEKVTKIGDYAFSGCNFLKMVNLPNSVVEIGNSSFSFCNSLQTIVLPNSVIKIADNAFHGCSSIQSVKISNSLRSIGKEAFSFCKSLQEIDLPNSLNSIGEKAFEGCESLKNLIIPNSVLEIGPAVFISCNLRLEIQGSKFISDGTCLIDMTSQTLLSCHSDDLEHYSIPNTIKNIGDNAFRWCDQLKSIYILKSVTRIGNGAFTSCRNLQSINIPISVNWIGDLAFMSNSSLGNVIIPPTVTRIGRAMFILCTSLQMISLPSSISSVDRAAFSGCKNLKNILIPRGTRAKFENLLPDYKDMLVEINP